jgi:hypothetical protein
MHRQRPSFRLATLDDGDGRRLRRMPEGGEYHDIPIYIRANPDIIEFDVTLTAKVHQ